MSITVTSLDQPKNVLAILQGDYLQVGDLFLATGQDGLFFYPQAQLIAAGFGTGNYNYICPLYAAARDTIHLFRQNGEDVLMSENHVEADLFHVNANSIITYGLPDWYPSSHTRLDLMQSNAGFFGVRVWQDFGKKTLATDVIWLCGPENKEYAAQFGEEAYAARRTLFSHVYESAAATNPIQMSNPIFPGEDGLKYITRGNNNAYNF